MIFGYGKSLVTGQTAVSVRGADSQTRARLGLDVSASQHARTHNQFLLSNAPQGQRSKDDGGAAPDVPLLHFACCHFISNAEMTCDRKKKPSG